VVLQLRLSFTWQQRSSETVRAVVVQHGKAFGSTMIVERGARVGGRNLMKSRIIGTNIYRGLDLIS
jgi:hypothetical protein